MLSTCTNGVLGVASLSTLPTYPIDGPRATSHTQGDDLLDTPRVVIISMQAKDFSIAGRTEMYLALKVHPPKNFCSRTFPNVPLEVFREWVGNTKVNRKTSGGTVTHTAVLGAQDSVNTFCCFEDVDGQHGKGGGKSTEDGVAFVLAPVHLKHSVMRNGSCKVLLTYHRGGVRSSGSVVAATNVPVLYSHWGVGFCNVKNTRAKMLGAKQLFVLNIIKAGIAFVQGKDDVPPLAEGPSAVLLQGKLVEARSAFLVSTLSSVCYLFFVMSMSMHCVLHRGTLMSTLLSLYVIYICVCNEYPAFTLIHYTHHLTLHRKSVGFKPLLRNG